MAGFAERGVIEGFYGQPWSRDDRLDVLAFCAARGMNAYVYAPKSEPKHRARWREAYAADEQAGFAELSRHCRALGMRFGFCLSPGLDIDYHSSTDRSILRDKLRAALDLGVDWLVVAFDDSLAAPSAGRDQGALVAWLHDALDAADSGVRMSVVPVEYFGVWPSPYLAALAAVLPPDVDVMWTGPHVVSPTITAADAEHRGLAVGGRRPLLWDNYPVNDLEMRRSLFLGPYRGRDPALADVCSGVLCNPMPFAQASKVALATAAAFLGAPQEYRVDAAWKTAIDDVGGPGSAALGRLAAACADSALTPPSATPGHHLLEEFEEGRASLADVASFLGGEPGGDTRLAERLEREVRPWLDQLELEEGAGRGAVRLLEAVERDDAKAGADAAEALQAAWSRARRADAVNVLGPRFASYPITGVDGEGTPFCDLRSGVVEDASLVDRLCRRAVDAYMGWLERQGWTGAGRGG